MSRRFDSRTTIFSPEGRLHQVEYALEAINNAGTCLGILATDGVVLAAERRVISKLLEPVHSSEKLYGINNNIACAAAGMTSDANFLIDQARLQAQRYIHRYSEDIPVEQIVGYMCDIKHSNTQFGGLRPYGVSFLWAGHDRHHGFQLYSSDPSGNYAGWKATCIGANNQAAQSILKQDYNKDDKEMNVAEAKLLAIKVLSKTMESTTLSSEKLEFGVLSKRDKTVQWKMLTNAEVDQLIKEADVNKKPTTEEKK